MKEKAEKMGSWKHEPCSCTDQVRWTLPQSQLHFGQEQTALRCGERQRRTT